MSAKFFLRYLVVAIFFGFSFAASAGSVLAHEVWLLSPLQVADLVAKPLPEIFTRWTVSGLILACAAAFLVLMAVLVDPFLERIEQRFIHLDTNTLNQVVVLTCRLGLGILLVSAALGLAPRHGSSLFSQSTLFVGDLELSMVSRLAAHLLVALQISLGLMLLTGVYPRLASLGVVALAGIGYTLFGSDMHAYIGHLLAPALVVFLLSERRNALWVASRLPLASQSGLWLEKLLGSIEPRKILILFRVLIGVNFIYLAIAFKIQQPNLIVAILDSGRVPTFGLSLEVLAFVMALVELTLGLLILLGVAVRISALVLVGAMLFFAVTLGEPLHVHANIIGAVLTLLLTGTGRETGWLCLSFRQTDLLSGIRSKILHNTVSVPMKIPLLSLTRLKRHHVLVVCCLAFAGFWMPALTTKAEFSEKLFKVVETPFPITLDFHTKNLGEGRYQIEIETSNFEFSEFCIARAGSEPLLKGHVHVYADGIKVATAKSPIIEIGPFAKPPKTLTLSLNDSGHRFLIIGGKMVLTSKALDMPTRLARNTP
jgi:uncharacterized membrane protein YphA (DoxX/SURF4 family)